MGCSFRLTVVGAHWHGMETHPRHPELTELAAEQAGVISLDQLRTLKYTDAQRRTMCRQGFLSTVAPRVYAVVGAPSTVRQRLFAGVLCLGQDAAVSHESAAHLHGLGGDPTAAELTIVRTSRGRSVPFHLHTTERWRPTDRVHVDGLRCTSATRTILDLAATGVAHPRLERAVDAAVRAGLSSPIVLAEQLAPGRRGARALRALLPDSGGHGWLERRFLELVRRHRLPRPTTQMVHRRGGRTVARTDFCWDDQNLVVEVSGRLGHASDAERARDAQRRNELQDMGRRVYEFTRADVVDRPDYVVGTLRPLLDVRANVVS